MQFYNLTASRNNIFATVDVVAGRPYTAVLGDSEMLVFMLLSILWQCAFDHKDYVVTKQHLWLWSETKAEIREKQKGHLRMATANDTIQYFDWTESVQLANAGQN